MQPLDIQQDRIRFVEDAFILLTPIILVIVGLGTVWFWPYWIW